MVTLPALHSHRRGQALVEMAIILPLLVLLLVMALDAGRLFFGWVALQNASRIGADYAASHAAAWDGKVDSFDQEWLARYELLVRQDLQALGCQGNPVPDPNFDLDSDGTEDFDDGDLTRVELACSFGLLTPLAESFLGAPVTLHGRSDFAINRIRSSGLPPPANPPPPPPPSSCVAPDFVGPPAVRKNSAQAIWDAAGFTSSLVFLPGSGNYFIGLQAPLLGGQIGDCSSTIETVGP